MKLEEYGFRLIIIGFAEGCGPRFNRGIWALFKAVARRLYSLPDLCSKSLFWVFGILSIQCFNVSLVMDMFMWYLTSVYLNILKEFDKNIYYSFLYSFRKEHEWGQRKTFTAFREEGENWIEIFFKKVYAVMWNWL